jgi:hypothetical protein
MINFVYYFIIPLCIMADIIRKPIQMVGFGILGAGSGLIIGTSVGFSILFVNDSLGYILSGGQSDPVEYKPLDAGSVQIIMLIGTVWVAMAGGIAGATLGAIV